jgi:hypothetical protein
MIMMTMMTTPTHQTFIHTTTTNQLTNQKTLPLTSFSCRTINQVHPERCSPLHQRPLRHPPPGNLDPLGGTRSLLVLDFGDIRVAATAATNAILLRIVPVVPVLVLGDALALVLGGLLEPGLAGQLLPGRVGRAVLDGGVPVAKVAEVVDVAGREEGAGRERVDGCVAPLFCLQKSC